MKRRSHIWILIVVIPVGALIVFVAGLFAYMRGTATPIHPDAAAIPSAVASAPPSRWAPATGQAREAARSALAIQNLPGLSVAVGVGGDIVWAEGFGFANLENHATVTPKTRFRIGEVSIPLTATAAGLLIEKGTLNLDAEIQSYVPEFPEKQWPVTLRQVMADVAGIRNDAGDEESLDERCARTADGVRRFADSQLLFEPGTRFRPSSYGWVLVSAAVETAAEEPFFGFMRRRVFEPAGMSATEPDLSSQSVADRASFYFPRFAGDTHYGPEDAREGDYSCSAGSRGFLSTPSDLVRFGAALYGGRLLQAATLKLLQTPQRLTTGQQSDYALGWMIESVPLAGQPTRMASHGTKNDFIGGTTSLLTFPERNLIVAVTTNISFADTRSVALKIAEAFAAKP